MTNTTIIRVQHRGTVAAIKAFLVDHQDVGIFIVYNGFNASMTADALDELIADQLAIVRHFINGIGDHTVEQCCEAAAVLHYLLEQVERNGGSYQYFPEAGFVLSDLPGLHDG